MGSARAIESVIQARTSPAPGPEGLRRRRPQRPGQEGEFWKRGPAPSCTSVANLLLGGLGRDREDGDRELRDVEVADRLAHPLRDADLHLHTEGDAAEHPDLVTAGEEVV